MLPRLLLRTHYQADEPRLIIATVLHCSSATDSTTEDRVAERLKKWARDNGYILSTPGATYAVGNARHLGLLTKSYRWAGFGLALRFLDQLIPAGTGLESKVLTPLEERYYFKLYLLGAGALPVMFARWLLQRGSVADEHLRTDAVLKKLTIQLLDEYLSLATDVRERTAIRQERDRIRNVKYSAITNRHKRYPLLSTMERLRLLSRTTTKSDDVLIEPDASGRLAAFSRAVPDIEALERLVRQNNLQETLDIEMREHEREDLPTALTPRRHLLDAYLFAQNTGLLACPLVLLDDVLGAIFPTSPSAKTPTAESILDPLRKALPREVRFHVDRKGTRSFVVLGDAAIECLQLK